MKRLFDITLAIIALIVFAIPMVILALLIRLTSKGPALYWSQRVGKQNKIFLMPKFRSMHIDAPQIATHLMADPKAHLIPVGDFIRKSSLDELPQIFSVFSNDMSFVGPRPALFNQYDLIELRTKSGVHLLKPGITGWAQINGRDEIPIPQKVALDAEYLKRKNFFFDLKIILLTAYKVVSRKNITH